MSTKSQYYNLALGFFILHLIFSLSNSAILLVMISKFLEWIGLKEKLHLKSEKPPYFKEKEIWWCAVGQNVGVEMNGKGNMFSRPILIYKKLNDKSFLAISLSTQIKEGSWYLAIDFKGKLICLNLAQIRTMSVNRLYTKLGEVTTDDFAKVKSGFLRLYL